MVTQIHGLNCYIRLAQNESAPVLIFLHGMGTRGTDVELLIQNPFFREAGALLDRFHVVAPQCAGNTWNDEYEKLLGLCKAVKFGAGNRQVFLMGTSMGGYASWQLGMSLPGYFDAIVPLCGGGMYANAARLVGTPIWAFHGALDQTVAVEESIRMVQAICKLGGTPKLTIYEDLDHNCWDRTYAEPAVYDWLLHQKSDRRILDLEMNSEEFG